MNRPATPTATRPLAGRVIALPEGRELDLLASMVQRVGGEVRRCPLVSIHDTPDAASVQRWLGRLNAAEMDDLILMTGEGVRRLLGFADRSGVRDDAVRALGAVRKITRGPKPGRALREVGLRSDLRAATPTTEGVIETLERDDLTGRTIGVQLYGDNPNERLMRFLREAGAVPDPVAPYVYGSHADDRRVLDLIVELEAGNLDAIAFTSGAQVRRLLAVAAEHRCERPLHEGLKRVLVAAVGPLVAQRLRNAGVRVDVMPQRTYFMKPLVARIVAALGD